MSISSTTMHTLAMAMFCVGSTAEAAAVRYFSFFQGGYSDGAALVGLFSAADDNGNGIFEQEDCWATPPSVSCEFRSFRMLFTGNDEFPAGRIRLYSEELINDRPVAEQGWFYRASYDPADAYSLSFNFQQFSLDYDASLYYVNQNGGGLRLNLYYGVEGVPPDDFFLTSTDMPARVFEAPLPGGLALMATAMALAAAARNRRGAAFLTTAARHYHRRDGLT